MAPVAPSRQSGLSSLRPLKTALCREYFDIFVMRSVDTFHGLSYLMYLTRSKAKFVKKGNGANVQFFTQGYIFGANRSKNLKEATLAPKPC